MPARYPHDAALTLRRSERMRAEGELAGAQRACERARAARQEADGALEQHMASERARAASDRAEQRSSVVELQRAAAFTQRQAERKRRLRAALEHADVELLRAGAALERAQHTLAVAHGRERAVEQDRERFERDQHRAAEQAEEDEQLEQRAARKRS